MLAPEGRKQAAARQDIVKVEKKLKATRAKPRIEPILPSLETSARAEKERQVPLFEPSAVGELPPLSLLDDPPEQKQGWSKESLEAMSRLVELNASARFDAHSDYAARLTPMCAGSSRIRR